MEMQYQSDEHKSEQIQFQMATFKPTALKKILEDHNICNMLKNSGWSMVFYQFQNCNWKFVFDNMIETKATSVDFGWNQHSTILKQINHVKFINLKQLYLWGNNLDNIQPLGWIFCQNLQVLFLNSNCINSINCFKKLSLKNLNWLDFNINPLNELKSFTKTKINSKFNRLSLDGYQCAKLIIQDFSILVRLDSQNFNQIYLQSQFRIKQPKIYNMLQTKRYLNSCLFLNIF